MKKVKFKILKNLEKDIDVLDANFIVSEYENSISELIEGKRIIRPISTVLNGNIFIIEMSDTEFVFYTSGNDVSEILNIINKKLVEVCDFRLLNLEKNLLSIKYEKSRIESIKKQIEKHIIPPPEKDIDTTTVVVKKKKNNIIEKIKKLIKKRGIKCY